MGTRGKRTVEDQLSHHSALDDSTDYTAITWFELVEASSHKSLDNYDPLVETRALLQPKSPQGSRPAINFDPLVEIKAVIQQLKTPQGSRPAINVDNSCVKSRVRLSDDSELIEPHILYYTSDENTEESRITLTPPAEVQSVRKDKARVSSKKGSKKLRRAETNSPALFTHTIYRPAPRYNIKICHDGVELTSRAIAPVQTEKPRIQRKIGEKKPHRASIKDHDLEIRLGATVRRISIRRKIRRVVQAAKRTVDKYIYPEIGEGSSSTPKESRGSDGTEEYLTHRDIAYMDHQLTYPTAKRIRNSSMRGNIGQVSANVLEDDYDEIGPSLSPHRGYSQKPMWHRKLPDREDTYITLVSDSLDPDRSGNWANSDVDTKQSENRSGASSMIVPDVIVLKGGHVIKKKDTPPSIKHVRSEGSLVYGIIHKPVRITIKNPGSPRRLSPQRMSRKSTESTVYSVAPPVPLKMYSHH